MVRASAFGPGFKRCSRPFFSLQCPWARQTLLAVGFDPTVCALYAL